jgi:hypothetical protein
MYGEVQVDGFLDFWILKQKKKVMKWRNYRGTYFFWIGRGGFEGRKSGQVRVWC